MGIKMVRSIDERVWSGAKAKAARQGITMGQVLNELLKLWITGRIKVEKQKQR